ncbi:MAG: ABC transporter permease subunit [Armatimonadota bacterium]|nr:ABC transporter permease subunit [Armatimonadota bacterium]
MERVRIRLVQATTLVLLGLGWELASRQGLVDPLFVPPPSAVAAALGPVSLQALPRLGETLLKTLAGYAAAVTIGVVLGLVLGSARTLREVVMPYLVAAYSLPKILLVPWIVLSLGVRPPAAMLGAALFAVFPIVVQVTGGVRDVEPLWLVVATSMGASRWQVYVKVVVPAALPAILAGMRVGAVFAFVGALLTEMFAGIRGMGFLMQQLALAFNAAALLAATALISVFSIAAVLGLDHLNRRLGAWR